MMVIKLLNVTTSSSQQVHGGAVQPTVLNTPRHLFSGAHLHIVNFTF